MLAEFEKRDPIQLVHQVAAFLCPSFKNIAKHLELNDKSVERVHRYVKSQMRELQLEMNISDESDVENKPISVEEESKLAEIMESEKESDSSDEFGDSDQESENELIDSSNDIVSLEFKE